MRRFAAGSVLTVLIAAAMLTGCSSARASNRVLIYYASSCTCCEKYTEYLEERGFEVEIVHVEDMSPIREQYQIPPEMFSCHTLVIEGYFVEGHMPMEAIEALLEKRPSVDGIALPGMPPGSPGMPGAREDMIVYAVSGGNASVFFELVTDASPVR